MAYAIKQENYNKRPTTDQRKLLNFLHITIPNTRIEAHLALAAVKSSITGRMQIRNWQQQQLQARELRRLNAQPRTAGQH